MADKVDGTLEIGPNDRSEVVVFIPADTVRGFSTNDGGHIVFSPNQARGFAEILLYHASHIDGLQVSNTAIEMREALEKIAARRPVSDKAANAFYRSRQDAKDVLGKLKASS